MMCAVCFFPRLHALSVSAAGLVVGGAVEALRFLPIDAHRAVSAKY